MLLRSSILLVVLSGCAVGASTEIEQTPAPAAAAPNAELRDNTIQEHGTVTPGGTASVDYERYAGRTSVPYFGIALAPSPGEGLQAITVSGPFPGVPEVVVVDENFVELARATGTANGDGTASVNVLAPRVAVRNVLVRDGLWSRPMTFQVTAAK